MDYIKGAPAQAICAEQALCQFLPQLSEIRRLDDKIQINCRTTQQTCELSMAEACSTAACTAACARQTGQPTATCKLACGAACEQFYVPGTDKKVSLCTLLMLNADGIKGICPNSCLACKPGTRKLVCELGGKYPACTTGKYIERQLADPAATLAFAVQVHKLGRGTTLENNDNIYGALQFPKGQGDFANLSDITVLFNSTSRFATPTFLNVAVNAMLKSTPGLATTSVAVNCWPLPKTQTIQASVDAFLSIIVAIFMIMAFAFVPAAVVSFVVRERELHHNSKHQQYISGVSIPAYWLANLVWDLATYAVTMLTALALLLALDVKVLVGDASFWPVFTLLLAYGLSVIPFTYLMSQLFSTHTRAQVWCLILNIVAGVVLMIASYIMSIVEQTMQFNGVAQWWFRLFPAFSFGHGIFQIVSHAAVEQTLAGAAGTNMSGVPEQYAAALQEGIAFDYWSFQPSSCYEGSPEEVMQRKMLDSQCGGAGWEMAYMFVMAPLLMGATMLVDMIKTDPSLAQRVFSCLPGTFSDPSVEDEAYVRDEDVQREEARVEASVGQPTDDVIRLEHLRKTYRGFPPKAAVRDLSFGLPKGEVFGFLGINGAGKTSTMNMLTGAVLPSGGTAYLGGKSIITQQKDVRRLIGYCPQHDALLDLLSVREHLQLFGRIKGVAAEALEKLVQDMMSDLSLQPHEHKLAQNLSGGNKRKLSVAIALMGGPPLVFLDEPSTGVDPVARRFMWEVISRLCTEKKECSVVLTTHNMEEAEALCTKVGVMVGGRLRCLGSGQHLKGRFGKGYELELKLAAASNEEADAMAAEAGLSDRMPAAALSLACKTMGDESRSELLTEGNEQGYLIFHAMFRPGGVSSRLFCIWWSLLTRAQLLSEFLDAQFAGYTLLERHDRSFRFRLPPSATPAGIFCAFEEQKERLGVQEYGVSQTSLEQIFNQFAVRSPPAVVNFLK